MVENRIAPIEGGIQTRGVQHHGEIKLITEKLKFSDQQWTSFDLKVQVQSKLKGPKRWLAEI